MRRIHAWLAAGALATLTLLSGMPTAAAPSDPTVFRFTPITAADTGVTAFQIAEPSVATDGTTILATFNFGAGLSADGGSIYTPLDPSVIFPTDAPWCCDQRVLYEPSRGLFIWALLYGPDPAFVRLGVATPARAVKGRWNYWDFHASDIRDIKGVDASWYFASPQIGTSSNFLYLTGLYGRSGAIEPTGAAVFRMPLDELAQGVLALTLATYTRSFGEATSVGQSVKAMAPVQGASSTMYFGQNVSTTALDLTVWPEGGTPSVATVAHTLSTQSIVTCVSPSGRNLCSRLDARVQSGWVGDGGIGFVWTAGPGGPSGRIYPSVQVIRIDESTRTLLEQPTFASDSAALIYPAVSRNARGDLAMIATIVGPRRTPSVVAFLRDEVSGPTQWTQMMLRESALSPSLDGWGDYQTIVPASPTASTWLAATFSVQPKPAVPGSAPTPFSADGLLEVDLVAFGREKDAPGASPSAPAATSTASPTPAPSSPPSPPPAPSVSPSPSPSPASGGRCSASAGPVAQRVATFWRCVDALSASDRLIAEDLGQWARNVIELDPAACITVADFRGSAATMQNAMDTASAGIPAAPPKSADVEQRIAAFWKKVDGLGPLDYLAAGDLGQWALNVIDRDPSRQIRVDDFRASTAAMQAAFDRAKLAGAACR